MTQKTEINDEMPFDVKYFLKSFYENYLKIDL